MRSQAKSLSKERAYGDSRNSDALLSDPNFKLPVDVNEHLIDSFLFLWIKLLNYIFMLIAMTFNFGAIMSIIFGTVLSNFFWDYMGDINYIDKKTAKNIANY